MNNIYFIGDAFMAHKAALAQKEFLFAGAKKLDSGKWQISILVAYVNGYAGGGSTFTWDVAPRDRLRVSASIKGYFIVDGFNKQKIRERSIREIVFKNIEKDMIELEFVE